MRATPVRMYKRSVMGYQAALVTLMLSSERLGYPADLAPYLVLSMNDVKNVATVTRRITKSTLSVKLHASY